MNTGMRMIMAALAGLLLMTAAALEAAPSAVGFIAGIRGKGYIVRGGNTILISGMDLLYPKDTVRLNRDASARITICGSKGYEIRGEASITVHGAALAFRWGRASKTYQVDKKTCPAALEVFGKNEARLPVMVLKDRKRTLVLSSREKSRKPGVHAPQGGGKTPAIELYADKLMPQRPFFAWTPVPGRASYLVRIKNGEDPLWTVTLTKNSFEYPQGAPPLDEAQVYNVTIKALSGKEEVLARGEDTFSLFTKEEVESFRRDEESIMSVSPEGSPDRQILLGKMFESRGEIDSALSSYEKALARGKHNAGLRERISLLKKILELN